MSWAALFGSVQEVCQFIAAIVALAELRPTVVAVGQLMMEEV